MSKNSIKLSINAKDNASKVLGSVKASTVALGVMVGNLATKGLTALINQTRSFIDAAFECERANMAVSASLRGTGQYTVELDKKMKDLAGTIQDEIGGSDEYFKDLISQLITLDVASEKVDQATRAVTALAAIGRKGSRAIQAVAKAVEGDYSAFEQMIPALKTATTDTEKLAIINQTLAAGYKQQQANLQTVGGAWEALKGRLGDAQEAFTNAIFDGLNLSETFGDMQVAVGKFLEGEPWANFLEHLKNGAAFAKDLAKSLTSTGGFSAVGISLGKVILAALKDGAEYLSHRIKEAWEITKKSSFIGGATRAFKAYNAGEDMGEAYRTYDSSTEVYKGQDRLGKAMDELKRTVAEQNKKTDENTKEVKENTKEGKKPPALTINVDAQTKRLEGERDKVDKQIARQQAIDDKAAAQQRIKVQDQNIADAEKKIAAADAVIKDRKSPAEAVRERNQQIADDKATKRENDKVMQRYDNLKMRQEAAGNLKFKMSDKDQALVDSIDAEKERQAAAERIKEDALVDKDNAEQRKQMAEIELANMQRDQLAELKEIRKQIVQALTVNS